MDIEINLIEANGVLVMDIDGRVDSVTAITLGEQLLAAWEKDQNQIVLDVGDVEYITSAGLREIMSGVNRAKKGGGDLRLAAPSARVSEVLELTGFIHHLGVFATREEAVASFA
ncbi:MAG: STAS domain-containing protein [Anaerolineae bacterium]|nr:STAS domain-containing protein [Anaerolineae bacterium]